MSKYKCKNKKNKNKNNDKKDVVKKSETANINTDCSLKSNHYYTFY